MAERGKLSIHRFAVLRRSEATVHNAENLCVLFVCIPFFRGHVYRTNEDLISVYKGPFMLKGKGKLDRTSPLDVGKLNAL